MCPGSQGKVDSTLSECYHDKGFWWVKWMKTELTIVWSNKKVIGDFDKGEKFCLQ